ncbi:hypothetical protein BSKO_04578 [Bryopsis sp. KO-2023]|nr:hypothetical protein BSKO_04578 [Bryopsis sp. KO-2023]
MTYDDGHSLDSELIDIDGQPSGQLSELESIHVQAILRATLEKLALVGAIKVDPQVQAQELTLSVGEEITRMIYEQKDLEKQFNDLISVQHGLRNMPNKSKLRENQAELQRVSHQLRQSTKQLCRNLKDNPNVAENMGKVSAIRQSLTSLLLQCLGEVESDGEVKAMVETVMAQEKTEAKTIDRERRMTAAVRQLKNDLKDEKSDHEEKMREKRKALAILKEQLKEVKARTTIESRFRVKDVTAKNECLHRLEGCDVADLERDLDLTRHQIQIEKSVHEASAEYLKNLQANLQQESINWTQKSDKDIQEKEKEIQVLRANHQRDLTKLRDVEEKYKAEVALKNDRALNEKQLEHAAEAFRLVAETKRRAAVKIQALFRGWQIRKELKGGKKGAKKGGKGKKGKKK